MYAPASREGAQVIAGAPEEMDAIFVIEMKRGGDLARRQNIRAE